MRITLDDSEIQQQKKTPFKKDPKQSKQPLSTKQKITRVVFSITAILLTIGITYIGYFGYKAYKTGLAIGFKLRPNDIIAQDIPKLKTYWFNLFIMIY